MLTERQLEVAIGLAGVESYATLAERFGVTRDTIAYFSKLVRAELGVRSRREIGPALIKAHLTTPDEIMKGAA